jgi:ABC-type Fe3+ transport system substrate-binding protein
MGAILALAGCSGGGSPSGDSSGSDSANKTWTSEAALVKAAKAEAKAGDGTVNIYMAPEYTPFAVPGFEKAYPWAKVNATELEPVPAVAKFSAEVSAGFSNSDVVFMHTSGVQTFKSAKAIAQVTVPNDSKVDPGLQDPNHYFHPVVELPEVILYNTSLVSKSDIPANVKDLSDPKYAGNLVMDTPQLGGPAGFVLASERSSLGDAGWKDWLQQIENGKPSLTGTSSDSYASLLRGDKSYCICSYGDYISQKPGTPVGLVAYGQGSGGNGVVVEPIVGVISNTAPHPALAALFVNWMLSADGGQAGFVSTSRVPVITGVPGSDAVSLPSGTKVFPLVSDLGAYITDPDTFNSVYKDIFK